MIQLLCQFNWAGAGETLLDALLDSALIVPILFLAHVLMALVDRYAGKKTRKGLNGPLSPLVGAAAGCFPQCGFSVAATRLYTQKYIPLGALIAVYISTSDEAVLILLSSPQAAKKLLPLLGIKLVFALVAGYTLNFIAHLAEKNKRRKAEKKGGSLLITCHAADDLNLFSYNEGRHEVPPAPTAEEIKNPSLAAQAQQTQQQWQTQQPPQPPQSQKDAQKDAQNAGFSAPRDEKADGGEECGCDCHAHSRNESCGCGCPHTEKASGWHTFVFHPLVHTLKISAYVLAVNLALGFIIFFVTPQRFSEFISGLRVWQPVFAALIGLIPNCAPTVILAEMYAGGLLTFGAAVAGLSAAAGLGYAVLIKEHKNKLTVLLIILGMFISSTLLGMATDLFF